MYCKSYFLECEAAFIDDTTICIYIERMKFTWSSTKCQANIKTHGLDFVDTENEHEIRIISFRKATRRESQIYFHEINN